MIRLYTFVIFDSSHEIATHIHHEFESGGENFIGHILKECVCLISKFTFVIDLCERLGYFFIVDFAEVGQGVLVGAVVVILNVESAESVVTLTMILL